MTPELARTVSDRQMEVIIIVYVWQKIVSKRKMLLAKDPGDQIRPKHGLYVTVPPGIMYGNELETVWRCIIWPET